MRSPILRGRAGAAATAALAVSLLSFASACAQQGGAAESGRGARGGGPPVSPDSVAQRAERSRFKGSETAPVTIVEVSDFQCPFCRQFVEETWPKLDSAYVQTGKVRVVFIHLPLPMHAEAFAASEAAMCAGAQGKFWPMHDRLFAAQREWAGQADAGQRFARFAVELELDAAAYRECVENDRAAALIVNDVMRASGSGVQGTPTFFLNGQTALSGAIPFEQMRASIDSLLAAAPAAGAAPAPAPGAPATPPARP